MSKYWFEENEYKIEVAEDSASKSTHEVIYNLHEDCLVMKDRLDELKAHVRQLNGVLHDIQEFGGEYWKEETDKLIDKVIEQTPTQSLQEIKRQAILGAANAYIVDGVIGGAHAFLVEYANNLTKEGE